MSTTAPRFDWPIPNADGSDPIPALANIIAQLGTAIANQPFLPNDSHKAADLPSAYPQGISFMGVVQGSTAGWPSTESENSAGTLMSIRRGDETRTYQFYFVSGQNSSLKVVYRMGSSAGWLTDWLLVTSKNSVQASATGQITLSPPSGGGTVVGTVLFPTGRFSSPPRVQLTPVTTTPGDVSVGLNDTPSADNCKVSLSRGTATATSIQWTAILQPE